MGPLTGPLMVLSTFQGQLCCDFSAAKLKTGKLGPSASAAVAWTLLFEQPYAVSDQLAHLTRWFFCIEAFIINTNHCKRNGAKRLSGWRDMQINEPFPLESTHLGYKCTTCAFSPAILYAGRLVWIWAHARVAYKVSRLGSYPESLVARGQARLFGVAGLNTRGRRENFAVRQLRLRFINPCLWCYHPMRITYNFQY
jgi:hypothetical protein